MIGKVEEAGRGASIKDLLSTSFPGPGVGRGRGEERRDINKGKGSCRHVFFWCGHFVLIKCQSVENVTSIMTSYSGSPHFIMVQVRLARKSSADNQSIRQILSSSTLQDSLWEIDWTAAKSSLGNYFVILHIHGCYDQACKKQCDAAGWTV